MCNGVHSLLGHVVTHVLRGCPVRLAASERPIFVPSEDCGIQVESDRCRRGVPKGFRTMQADCTSCPLEPGFRKKYPKSKSFVADGRDFCKVPKICENLVLV